MPDRWGDYPTWLAAIGTVAAVVVALYLAGADSRRRGRLERAHQAQLVTAWFTAPPGQGPHVVSVLNGSQQLVYRVIASLVPVRGTATPDFRQQQGLDSTAFRALIGELPPGQFDVEVGYPGGGGHIRWFVELVFRDAAGVTWVREADGRLRNVDGEPADYCNLHEPLNWITPPIMH
jgi:hypothetical protein